MSAVASIYGFIKGFNDKHKIVDALLPYALYCIC